MDYPKFLLFLFYFLRPFTFAIFFYTTKNTSTTLKNYLYFSLRRFILNLFHLNTLSKSSLHYLDIKFVASKVRKTRTPEFNFFKNLKKLKKWVNIKTWTPSHPFHLPNDPSSPKKSISELSFSSSVFFSRTLIFFLLLHTYFLG